MRKERTDIPPEYNTAGLRALQSMTAVERRMLREYYVNRKPLGKICDELGVTSEQFAQARQRARALFSNLTESTKDTS